MSLRLSSSSDEDQNSHSYLGTSIRVGTQNNTFVAFVHLYTNYILDSVLFVSVCWWEQYRNTATSGTDSSDLRNHDNLGLCVLEF